MTADHLELKLEAAMVDLARVHLTNYELVTPEELTARILSAAHRLGAARAAMRAANESWGHGVAEDRTAAQRRRAEAALEVARRARDEARRLLEELALELAAGDRDRPAGTPS